MDRLTHAYNGFRSSSACKRNTARKKSLTGLCRSGCFFPESTLYSRQAGEANKCKVYGPNIEIRNVKNFLQRLPIHPSWTSYQSAGNIQICILK